MPESVDIMSVFELLGGLGLFLFGMKLMGDGLELAAGARLKNLIEKLTRNKYMGALIGLAVTAVIQSSSATTVMVVGFVNAGLMNLAQAVGVIMGANIGTTVTGLIIAINLKQIAPLAVFAGVVMMTFLKRNSHRHIGQIIAGFGILFVGMSTMSGAMEPIGQSDFAKGMITSFQNPLIGVLVGLAFTAVIQSSSASVGVLQALAFGGAITLPSAVYVIYGQNIGTCVTALLSSVGTNKTAKRTAVVHLLFNVIGTLLFVLITLLLPFTEWMEQLAPGNVVLQISLVHICFNIVCTAILLPLSDYLVRLACRCVPGEDPVKEKMSLSYLDSRILSTPPIAVSQVLKEVERMAGLAENNFDYSMSALLAGDTGKIRAVEDNEPVIDFLNRGITEYLVKINALDLEDYDRQVVGALFHVVNDLERVGDHSMNIAELADQVASGKATLSSQAMGEIRVLYQLVSAVLRQAVSMFESQTTSVDLRDYINRTEDEIDSRTRQLKANHIERLNEGLCSAQSGTVYMDLLMNLERIADHSTNIAFALWEEDAANAARANPLAPEIV